MLRSISLVLAGAALVMAVACSDSTAPAPSPLLAAAFLSTPAGFSSTDNSFSAAGDVGEPWRPDRGAHILGAELMGGGLRPEFLGAMGMGRDWREGPFGFESFISSCAFSATTDRVTCAPVTHGGLTIDRSFAFTDASGAAQPGPSSTTNTIDEQVSVSGTVTRRDGAVTSTVQLASDRSVSGLMAGSTQRTVNGASLGKEQSQGTGPQGAFTASRTIADTTIGVVVPLQNGRPTYPIAGRVARWIEATVTPNGKAPTSSTRSEVITYDGSANAKVVITKDGAAKTCTMPLPRGKLVCS
jgi:hypothetical protein